MKPHVCLRIASGLAMLQAILHTIGGVFGTPLPGPASESVAAMKANHFLVMGFDRSYWRFFVGFGLAITISLVIESIVFWLLGSLVKADGGRVRPILGVFSIGYVVMAVLSYFCFFPPPAVSNLLIATCLLIAYRGAERAYA